MEPENNTKRWWVLIGISTVALIFFGVMILRNIKKEASKTTAEKLSTAEDQTAAQLKTKSGFRLKVLNKQVVRAGDDIRLGVYANSGKMDPVGFDLSMTYSKLLTYVTSESKLDGYDIIETHEDGKVIITGAKQLSNKKMTPWDDILIMELIFKAKKAGLATVAFELSPGSISDTNMFNNQNKDLVTIAIGSTIQIQ